ncbi:hypothetical protein [Mycobacterium sp. GA-2829]|uniref:hypothetical protein n=1 Tax=Mycobacterium sp. GA-2829 TaxID=1772283 RepID=UPI0007400019|nr:hypothetical protein [Mycobacterium sp. GA-2829]KUI39783.1 hypothetical protein AU194_24145 [Mycobacterium sp. GA-2829]
MNESELVRALATIGIPRDVLAIGGRADYSWCLERSADGMWEVYWYERGAKNSLVRLNSEADACFQLLGRMTYSQLLADAIAFKAADQ